MINKVQLEDGGGQREREGLYLRVFSRVLASRDATADARVGKMLGYFCWGYIVAVRSYSIVEGSSIIVISYIVLFINLTIKLCYV